MRKKRHCISLPALIGTDERGGCRGTESPYPNGMPGVVAMEKIMEKEKMGDMGKRAEKMETEEVEMNQRMLERLDSIDNATYRYLMQLLELGMDEAENKFPWNIEIFREVFEDAVAVLNKHGYSVCDPYISTQDTGRQYRCTLSECGCKSCNCQDEFMEKERLISNIEDAVALTGMKIMDGNKDSIIVRGESTDTDFEIRVSQLAG